MTSPGYYGSICDYTINVTGGQAPVPLVLKNINNDPDNIVDVPQGACAFKFTVEPRDEPCEGYYEWTFKGSPLNDHDREVRLDFPLEGDFELCVKGYVGIPGFHCGESDETCTTIRVTRDQVYGPPRILCNESAGYRWHQQKINTSGIYQQVFYDLCHVYDSIVEFIILPKPESGIINYVSCSKSEPYLDPIQKLYYRQCTHNKKIIIPKSTEDYACDSSYILNVAFIELENTFHLKCKNGNVYMTADVVNYTDTCGVDIQMNFSYAWFEKINNGLEFIGNGSELKILKKGNYQLHVLTQYQLGTEFGSCTRTFDEDIDEDTYLTNPTTGSLIGKAQVCKADIECYSVLDLVKNPYAFTWSVNEGTIITPMPDTSKNVCVQWDKNSTATHGRICATYSDSCFSNIQACLDVEFGKSQKNVAGPDQQWGGVLGAKMNAQGKKGLWTYEGGPGNAYFTDPTDPKTRVKVSRFGSYTFKWTTNEGDCEVYGFMTINFYIEFPQHEGEYYKPFYNLENKEHPLKNIKVNYLNKQLIFSVELPKGSNFSYAVFNMQGQLMEEGDIVNAENKITEHLSSGLSPGIYFIVIGNGSLTAVEKIWVHE
ncbi:MAG: T9SS type A sorting domain-containing protein [Saprospiraceae bacterium]|nr:T9SS type A sorting domain-containing protein [Saprospiraceae bacterium]